MNTFDIEEVNRHLQVIGAVAATIFILLNGKKYVVKGRSRNRCDADYASVVNKVMKLKLDKPALFTQMYRLSPKAFDEVLNAIQADLMPQKMTAAYFVPPMIKLCCALHFLAGGSYLDISFGYDIPPNTVHFYVWQALNAIDRSRDPLLDNIKSPIYATAAELESFELDFAKLSKYQLRGTIAAGDGIVFRMQMPTNEQVEGDVTAYYTRKGYYAYGLQVCTLICPLLIVILFLINLSFLIRLFVMQIVNLL